MMGTVAAFLLALSIIAAAFFGSAVLAGLWVRILLDVAL